MCHIFESVLMDVTLASILCLAFLPTNRTGRHEYDINHAESRETL